MTKWKEKQTNGWDNIVKENAMCKSCPILVSVHATELWILNPIFCDKAFLNRNTLCTLPTVHICESLVQNVEGFFSLRGRMGQVRKRIYCMDIQRKQHCCFKLTGWEIYLGSWFCAHNRRCKLAFSSFKHALQGGGMRNQPFWLL